MTRLLKNADFVTPLISGTWPGSSTLWLRCDRLLEHEVLKRFLPIRYTTVCCSHVEREHQFAPRTTINCSCRHVGEARRSEKPWSITMVSQGALYIFYNRSLTVAVKSICPADQVHCHQDVILELPISLHSISGGTLGTWHWSINKPNTKQVRMLWAQIMSRWLRILRTEAGSLVVM